MTLCIAWKKNNVVYFASDSRLTFPNPNTPPIDCCVKISSILLNIRGPVDVNDEYPEQVYEHSIGMCFSGSFINAYILKEVATQALSKLQVIPDITDVSMDQVCNLFMKFFELISKKVLYSLSQLGGIEFFLTGYCLKNKSIRTFKFSTNPNSNQMYSYSEILRNDGDLEFLGSGKSVAESKFVDLNKTPPLILIRDIISDNGITTVGGAIQYGEIDNREFKVYGIQDYVINEEKKEIEIFFHFNGIRLMNDFFVLKWDEFHIRHTYKLPFETYIKKYIEKDYSIKSTY